MAVFYAPGVGVFMFVLVFLVIVSAVLMMFMQVNVEFDARDLGLLRAGDVQMVTAEIQFLQFAVQLRGIHADIHERAEQHVATDAAENIQI